VILPFSMETAPETPDPFGKSDIAAARRPGLLRADVHLPAA